MWKLTPVLITAGVVGQFRVSVCERLTCTEHQDGAAAVPVCTARMHKENHGAVTGCLEVHGKDNHT